MGDHVRGNNSVERMAWLGQLSSDPKISPSAFQLAFLIQTHFNAGEDNFARPGQTLLAERLRTKERTILRLTDELVQSGHLERNRGGNRTTNRYRGILFEETKLAIQKAREAIEKKAKGKQNTLRQPDMNVRSGQKADQTSMTGQSDLIGHSVQPDRTFGASGPDTHVCRTLNRTLNRTQKKINRASPDASPTALGEDQPLDGEILTASDEFLDIRKHYPRDCSDNDVPEAEAAYLQIIASGEETFEGLLKRAKAAAQAYVAKDAKQQHYTLGLLKWLILDRRGWRSISPDVPQQNGSSIMKKAVNMFPENA